MSDDEEGTTLSLTEFDDNMELLTEKRTQLREEALESMCRFLRSQYVPQAVDGGRWNGIATYGCRLLKSASPRECAAAATLIGLSALTMGENQEFFEAVSGPLEAAALALDDEEACACAVRALGSSCFFSSSEPGDTVRCMDTLFDCFEGAQDDRPRVAAAAISEWSRLLTTAPERCDDVFDAAMAALTRALASADVEVRVHSGRAAALLFSLLHDNAAGSDGSDGEGEWDLSLFEGRCDVERLVALARSLSGTAGSKKDRARQQPEFRLIARTLQEGAAPEERVKIRMQEHRFSGWPELHQLEAVRAALSTGFHRHLECNEVLHAVFDLEVDADAERVRMSSVEKRLNKSPCSAKSKEQTRARAQRRDCSLRSESTREFVGDGDDDGYY
eukprot:m51a1_g5630 hypothetical protein (390) ;mRNA; r:805242-806754